MVKFKKGHSFGFIKGHVPYNKQRKCVPSTKNHIEQTMYVRLTRKMTNLVKNVTYKEDESESADTSKPAVLLRPVSSDIKKAKPVPSVKEKQR